MSKWRTDKPCDNCPFNRTGPGAHLRRSLEPGRWREILIGLKNGEHFYCHKTTQEDDNGEFTPGQAELICAGSIAWQDRHGTSAQMVRINERLDAMFGRREKKA